MKTLTQLITTVNEVINDKDKIDLKDYIPILSQYQGEDWKEYVKYDPNSYCKELVYKSKLYDIYVISWSKGTGAKIHDHSENGCIFKIISGNGLIEKVYKPSNLTLIKTNVLDQGDCGYICNSIAYHSINNPTETTCVSLHIYSPPGYKCKMAD